MDRWPWFSIILAALLVGLFVPLPVGWVNSVLVWGSVVAALAYGAWARRAN